jgi:hypothetical protein
MTGRPQRELDPAFAHAVRQHMCENGLSARSLAGYISVNVSTLTRSLNDGRFSRELRRSLEFVLEARSASFAGLLQEILDSLRKESTLREHIEKSVQRVLKSLEAAR